MLNYNKINSLPLRADRRKHLFIRLLAVILYHRMEIITSSRVSFSYLGIDCSNNRLVKCWNIWLTIPSPAEGVELRFYLVIKTCEADAR